MSSGAESDMVQTGQFVPGLEPYDEIVAGIMRKFRIPGAAVAVLKLVEDGRLELDARVFQDTLASTTRSSAS